MKARRTHWWVLTALCFAVGTTACKGEEAPAEDCVDDRAFFEQKVWTVVEESDCMGCHNAGGDARDTKFILEPDTVTGFIDANMTIMRDVAAFEKDGESLLLIKPRGGENHEGGALISADSEQYQVLAEMVQRFKEPVTCGEQSRSDEHFDGVVLMTPQETLRKSTINLAGRLPTAAEEFRVSTGGMEALEAELDLIMQEEPFYGRLEQMWNDMFLVERYVGRDNAVDLLDEEYYPNARWYMPGDEDNPRDFSGENQEFLEGARMYTNDAVALAPLKLATHLVRNDLPFTGIVSADYMLVNPYSARAYNVTGLQWEDPLDPNEWQPGKIPGHPHAGVLTDPMWLNRFPTTDTNRNRHRARMVYWFFLATDVLKLAERPLDVSSITAHNPTENDPNCNVCHSAIDPMAGLLQNWDEEGNYNPREEGWYPEMPNPGLGDYDLPYASTPSAAQVLATLLSQDRRFATAMVHHMYRGLTGQEPLRYPADATAPDFQAQLLQYQVQDRAFDNIAQSFIDTNFNLKAVIKGLVLTPYFRAKDHTSESEEVLGKLGELGQGRMLTPELLDKKIVSVTGLRWTDRDGEAYLLDEDEYLILYGGIDSDDVTIRISEPNGIMSGIQYRMANEMACATTARDFTQAAEKRRYFPYVTPEIIPADASGFDIPEGQAAIRKNIQHLHWHLLGETLDADDAQIEATYQVFLGTLNELKGSGLGAGLGPCDAEFDFNGAELPEEQRITEDPTYVIRSWQAVITYLLSDYKFLYE